MLQQMYVKASENIKLVNLQDNVKSILFKGVDLSAKPYRPAQIYMRVAPTEFHRRGPPKKWKK